MGSASSRILVCGVPMRGGGTGAGGPDLGLQEAEEAGRLVEAVEVEVDHDVVRVAGGPLDTLLAYPGLLPGLGEAAEGGARRRQDRQRFQHPDHQPLLKGHPGLTNHP